MQHIHIALTLALTSLLAASACEQQPELPYPGHSTVLQDALSVDAMRLTRLRSSARASADPEQLYVTALASYIADPGEYADLFVDTFPSNRAMSFVYEELERPRLTPSPFYSFVELGRVAVQGLPNSIERLLETTLASEPPVWGVLCDAFVPVLETHVDATLDALDALSPEERERLYGCLDLVEPERTARALEAVARLPGAAPLVARELAHRSPASPEAADDPGR